VSNDDAQVTDMLDSSVSDFIARTAAKVSTPGGGSVAGVVGALGVALGEMALNFTMGKKKYAEHEASHAHLSARMQNARAMFEQLVREDIAAYGLYQATSRQADGPDKDRAMQTAVAAAIDVPREMTKLSLAVLQDLLELSDKCNPWLITDLLAGGVLAVATVRLSDFNVRINVPNVADKQDAEDLHNASKADVAKAASLLERIEEACRSNLK